MAWTEYNPPGSMRPFPPPYLHALPGVALRPPVAAMLRDAQDLIARSPIAANGELGRLATILATFERTGRLDG